MKRVIPTLRTVILLAGLLLPISCLGTHVSELIATHESMTPTATPPPQVALLSFHGRYVTALGEDDDWSLRQEQVLSDCGWFTQRQLDNGRIALVTCYGRYVTAPRRGTTRWDWELWQESALGDCGQFILHDQGNGELALETCAGRFVTAGDWTWEQGLQWSVVAETDTIDLWERFTPIAP
jgi:hypothetical protein